MKVLLTKLVISEEENTEGFSIMSAYICAQILHLFFGGIKSHTPKAMIGSLDSSVTKTCLII